MKTTVMQTIPQPPLPLGPGHTQLEMDMETGLTHWQMCQECEEVHEVWFVIESPFPWRKYKNLCAACAGKRGPERSN